MAPLIALRANTGREQNYSAQDEELLCSTLFQQDSHLPAILPPPHPGKLLKQKLIRTQEFQFTD